MKPLSTPRRVLITADTVGGVWTFALDLASFLELHEVEVILATTGPAPDAGQREELVRHTNVTHCHASYALEWSDDPWSDVDAAGNWLLGLESHFCPDLVHLNGYSHGALRWGVPAMVTAHSCVCSWWRAVKGTEAPSRYDEYRERVRAGLDGAHLVVAPTQAMLADLHDLYAFSAEATVIWNGRSARQFHPASKKGVIMSAGRIWDEGKNLAALDTIAEQVAWPVEIAGDPVGPNSSALDLTNVRLLGRLSREATAGRLAASAIFALPAKYEPFGLSILEAALSGCALVLGDIPSLRELWEDAALFVNPNDNDALADALNTLIRHDSQRARLARAAHTRAFDFSLERFGKGYLAAYAECIASKALEVVA